MSKVIGEGSYGCVHKPSLECETKPSRDFNYETYISKLMLKKNAIKELKEFLIIDKIDKDNKYHFGNPILCEPKVDNEFKKNVKKCSIINTDNVFKHPEDYSLLLGTYGGNDLSIFCEKKLSKYLKTNKQFKTAQFFVEAHNLFKGLLLFKKYKLVHYDLKPQNILFDEKTAKFKYIDFGLMKRKKDIIKTSINNNNNSGILHWSYPFDCGFMNKEDFDLYNSNDETKLQVKQKFLNDFVLNRTGIRYPLLNNLFYCRSPKTFDIIFSYINTELTIPPVKTKNNYVRSFFEGFDELILRENYETILNRIIDSIDIYGLGFSLLFCLNHFNKLNAINIENYTLFERFFYNMCNFNPFIRSVDIEALLYQYEEILILSGFLQNYGMNIENHKIVPKKFIFKVDDEERKYSSDRKLSPELKDIANDDPPLRETKTCSDDKELNPKTNRCVNKCKNGYERNNEFKCIKITKKNKTKSKSITTKLCPNDKELNPKTNRCVNKCKNGYERNNEFKCIKLTKKNKTKKSSSITTKICPNDKELNPKTNRCVNKCKTGFKRNEEFNCRKN